MRRKVGVATAILLALVALVLFADRPVALWFDSHFHGSIAERIVIALFAGLDWILLLAGVALMAGVIMVRRRPQASWLRTLVSGGVATVIALATAQAIK